MDGFFCECRSVRDKKKDYGAERLVEFALWEITQVVEKYLIECYSQTSIHKRLQEDVERIIKEI